MTGAPITPVLTDGNDNIKKSKKRSREDEHKTAAGNGGDGESKSSKAERREAKRLKKLTEVPGAGQETKDALPVNGAVGGIQRIAANGDASEGKLSREARKETRRLKKLAKEQGNGTAVAESLSANNDGVNEVDTSSDKSTRKAEKVQLKAGKKSAKSGTTDAISQPDASNGKSKSTPGYEEDPTLTTLPQSEIDDFLSANFITIRDPTSSTNLRPITKFSHLPSSYTTASSSPFTTFKSPTPIQSAAWPFLLSGRDVIGVAETGSGKTLAFGVPCIRSITSTPAPLGPPARAVIVSPTRELAAQIHTQIDTLAAPARLSTVCVYGGVPKDPQRLALRTAHIIVATPGRLNDLITEGAASLTNVTYVVLDEADRMLDKGFEAEIRKIITTTPPLTRQTLMFTATWPPSVRTLASTFLRTPIHISIGPDNPTFALRANPSITQRIHVIPPHQKESRLLHLLHQHQPPTASPTPLILIFCLYKKEAARVSTFLQLNHHPATAIHGDMSQDKRTASLAAFKSGSCPLLVATDVAARGLDIPAVKVVINMTFPLTVEDYVHRIGRTGRAGAEGLAVTLFTEQDKGLAGGLVNVLRAAGQEVPEELLRFGTTVKKKGHEAYGAFYKEVGAGGKTEGTKIRFD